MVGYLGNRSNLTRGTTLILIALNVIKSIGPTVSTLACKETSEKREHLQRSKMAAFNSDKISTSACSEETVVISTLRPPSVSLSGRILLMLPRKILNLSNMSVDPELVVPKAVEKVTTRLLYILYINYIVYIYYICLPLKKSVQPLWSPSPSFFP